MSFVSGTNSSWSWALDEATVEEHLHGEEDFTIPIPLILHKYVGVAETYIECKNSGGVGKFAISGDGGMECGGDILAPKLVASDVDVTNGMLLLNCAAGFIPEDENNSSEYFSSFVFGSTVRAANHFICCSCRKQQYQRSNL